MLGTGIPSAIGSRIGAPDREVVCVTGDGAAGFNFMEMQSAARDAMMMASMGLNPDRPGIEIEIAGSF